MPRRDSVKSICGSFHRSLFLDIRGPKHYDNKQNDILFIIGRVQSCSFGSDITISAATPG